MKRKGYHTHEWYESEDPDDYRIGTLTHRHTTPREVDHSHLIAVVPPNGPASVIWTLTKPARSWEHRDLGGGVHRVKTDDER